MLVISRMPEQELELRTSDGARVKIKVLEVRGGKVRLGFTAPADCIINRREVWDEIDRGGAKPDGVSWREYLREKKV